VERLKRDYFNALAVSLKLSRALAGQPTNMRVEQLYEKAKFLKPAQWSDWLAVQVDKPQ
jgi:hypothetical protein